MQFVVFQIKILSLFHDPKKERYAVYYSVILLVIIVTIILLVAGILEISPIEGSMIFFEGFVALFMLSRHEKLSHSFSNYISQLNVNLKNGYSLVTNINFRPKH